MENKHTNDQRRKTSLRGKGREIFFGAKASEDEDMPARPSAADDTASDLRQDEAAALQALLSEKPASPASDVRLSYPDEDRIEGRPEHQEALPLWERGESDAAEAQSSPTEPTHPAVQALEPELPEIWPAEDAPPKPTSTAAVGDEGGLIAAVGKPPAWEDPFATNAQRPPAKELFAENRPADPALVYTLVDVGRIRELDAFIEDLLKELSSGFRAPAAVIDAYQADLKQASELLMASRENYDDARAIFYRVRGEIARQRQTEADIARYRPLLLNYYLGWGVTLLVLFLLRALFVGMAEAVGVHTFSALYYPALFGVVGAWISGLRTLERHTSFLRDFDPMHVSWYLLNPLLGGVMGVLMFLLLTIANDDLLRETASFSEVAIADLLCVVAGMNQSYVLRRLDELRVRVGDSSEANAGAPSVPPPPSQST